MASEQVAADQMQTGSAVVAVEMHDQRQSECPVAAHKLVPATAADDCSSEVCSGSDYDDVLTCLVCDRAFSTVRQLVHHQTRKHHFYCSVCDSRFASLTSLKQHKESEDHWSDCEDFVTENSATDTEPDIDSCTEKERLL